MVNHPPAGTAPNVASYPFDFPLTLPEELQHYIPNRYAKPVRCVAVNGFLLPYVHLAVLFFPFLLRAVSKAVCELYSRMNWADLSSDTRPTPHESEGISDVNVPSLATLASRSPACCTAEMS
jgi:hypothetical protein